MPTDAPVTQGPRPGVRTDLRTLTGNKARREEWRRVGISADEIGGFNRQDPAREGYTIAESWPAGRSIKEEPGWEARAREQILRQARAVLEYGDERVALGLLQAAGLTVTYNNPGMDRIPHIYKAWLSEGRGLKPEAIKPGANTEYMFEPLARVWEMAVAKGTADARAEGVVLTPLLAACLDMATSLNHIIENERGNTKDWLSVPGTKRMPMGADLERAGQEFADWVKGATQNEILPFITTGHRGLWSIIAANSPLLSSMEGCLSIREILVTHRMADAVKNPFLTEESGQFLVALCLKIIEQGDMPAVGAFARHINQLGAQGFAIPESGLTSAVAGLAVAQDKEAQQKRNGMLAMVHQIARYKPARQILKKDAALKVRVVLVDTAQGKEWLEMVTDLVTRGLGQSEKQIIRALARTTAAQLEGVGRADLLFLLEHPNTNIREEGIRIAGLVRAMETSTRQARKPHARSGR